MASLTETTRARDGLELRTRHWPVEDGTPWASLLLVHALAEHSGRYEHVGAWFAGQGIEVSSYDQRGFGASGGRRVYVEDFAQYHDDLEDRLAAVRATAGDRPVILYAHSLGGLIALGYVLAGRLRPDRLVLSAPGLDATFPAWKKGLARILGRLAPTLEIPNGLGGELLSRDPEVGRRYLADPLNHHASTTRFGALALAEQALVRAALARGELEALGVPTLVIQGTHDALVPFKATAAVRGRPGVHQIPYLGLRHELHNEPEWETVLADVVDWLREGRTRA